LNTSFLLPSCISALGTHTGQSPSPIVWRAVRRAYGPRGQKRWLIEFHSMSIDQ
jgi:hypothetical protein